MKRLVKKDRPPALEIEGIKYTGRLPQSVVCPLIISIVIITNSSL